VNKTLHHLIRLPYGRFTVFIGTLSEAQADCRNRDDWDCIGSAKIIRSFPTAVECNEYLFEELGV
jgi:hypothetical protein